MQYGKERALLYTNCQKYLVLFGLHSDLFIYFLIPHCLPSLTFPSSSPQPTWHYLCENLTLSLIGLCASVTNSHQSFSACSTFSHGALQLIEKVFY